MEADEYYVKGADIFGRSLIKMRNRTGPKTEPLGTPDRTGTGSHDLQYTRYFAYSDALKNSFFPRTIPLFFGGLLQDH